MHTPGPWMLNGNAIEIPDRFNAGMTAVLAHIYDERDIALDPAEIAANARLVVAAPEMYDALTKFLAAMRFWDAVPGDPSKDRNLWIITEATRKALQSAIAKAKGRC